jgi:hypothetical protein
VGGDAAGELWRRGPEGGGVGEGREGLRWGLWIALNTKDDRI